MPQHFFHILLEILPVFLVAVICAGLIEAYLPENLFSKSFLNRFNFINVILMALLGALIPICTCGMIPLAISLYRKGLDWRLLLAFLIPGNACSLPALMLTATISWQLAMYRLLATILLGLILVYILDWLTPTNFTLALIDLNKKHEEGSVSDQENSKTEPSCCSSHAIKKSKFQMVLSSIKTISLEFLPWILIAALLATFLDHYYSLSLEALNLAKSVWAPVVLGVITFPLYLCAGADVPLLNFLYEARFSLASLITFMLAAPSINLTTFIIYSKATSVKQAGALYLLMLFIILLIAYTLSSISTAV